MNQIFSSELFILIVAYKDVEYVKKAVYSIEEKAKLDIYILDNESNKQSFKELKTITSKHNIHIIQSKKNLGFSSGVNFALKIILKKSKTYKYMFLLNPDALLTEGLISNLKESMDKYSYSAVSPKILFMNGDIWFGGGYIDLQRAEFILNKYKNFDNKNHIPQFNGAVALLNIDSFMKAGMFNENLFLYCDEAFLSMEFKKLGLSIGYENNLIAYHDVSAITQKISGFKDYYINRNGLYFFSKYGTNSNNIYYRPLINFLYYLKRGNIKKAYYVFLAIIHFLMKKKGKVL